jgi:hypothetical protein
MADFKVGDKVKVVGSVEHWLTNLGLAADTILTVVDGCDDQDTYVNKDDLTVEIDALIYNGEDFTKVEDEYFSGANLVDSIGSVEKAEELEELGVYRPKLETRKIGKVQMHMVDDGFPNALRAVAEVMTWAAVAKGYKLHDWRNLPEADVALPSAGYRHRNDNSVQKAQGLNALDRTDHESKLLHKAHEAFNILAELELILTGVIK